jgi:hypothetical protein
MSAFAPKSRPAAPRGKRLSLVLPLVLAACVSHAPSLQNGDIGTIAGRETAGLGDNDARRKVLAEAARLTVDHGYRYFVILPVARLPGAKIDAVPTIHAGQAQRFQIVRRASASRSGDQVWDAYRLLTRQPKSR